MSWKYTYTYDGCSGNAKCDYYLKGHSMYVDYIQRDEHSDSQTQQTAETLPRKE